MPIPPPSSDETFQQLVEHYWDKVTVPDINYVALRSFIVRRVRFYAHALQNINIILEDIKKPAIVGRTNGFQIFLNPRMYAVYGEILKSQNKPWFATPEMGMAFVIMHEIGHIVFDTFGRKHGRNHRLWNRATDYQINQFVVKLMRECEMFSDDKKYKDFLHVVNTVFLFNPAKYEKMNAEMTYDDLYSVSMSKSGGGGDGDGCIDGDVDEEEDPNLSSEDRMTRDIIKSEMQNYCQKNADKLPGKGSAFREFNFVQEPPKVHLKQVLRNIADREVTDDWGFDSRGSRMDHLLTGGMRLPVIVPKDPTVVRKVFFVLDSSGSMTDEQLNDALNIIKECLGKYTRQPVYLIIHTSEIVYSKDLSKHTDLVEKFTGGTCFQPVIDEIARVKKEHRIIPSCVIWLTDYFGEKDFKPNELGFPQKMMKWIISGNPNAKPSTGATYFIDSINE